MLDKLTTKTKKVRSRKNSSKITPPSQPTSDMFTRLCHSELHAECIKEHRFYNPRKWRFDYALPRYKIAVEVEGGVWTGGRHIRPQGFLGDIEKYNTATLLGWRVFRTTPDNLLTGKTILLLKNAISGAFLPQNSEILAEK
jgi:hypothetical protein